MHSHERVNMHNNMLQELSHTVNLLTFHFSEWNCGPIGMTSRFLLSSIYLINIPVTLWFNLMQRLIVIYIYIYIHTLFSVFGNCFSQVFEIYILEQSHFFDSQTKLIRNENLINTNSVITLGLSASVLLLKWVIWDLENHF